MEDKPLGARSPEETKSMVEKFEDIVDEMKANREAMLSSDETSDTDKETSLSNLITSIEENVFKLTVGTVGQTLSSKVMSDLSSETLEAQQYQSSLLESILGELRDTTVIKKRNDETSHNFFDKIFDLFKRGERRDIEEQEDSRRTNLFDKLREKGDNFVEGAKDRAKEFGGKITSIGGIADLATKGVTTAFLGSLLFGAVNGFTKEFMNFDIKKWLTDTFDADPDDPNGSFASKVLGGRNFSFITSTGLGLLLGGPFGAIKAGVTHGVLDYIDRILPESMKIPDSVKNAISGLMGSPIGTLLLAKGGGFLKLAMAMTNPLILLGAGVGAAAWFIFDKIRDLKKEFEDKKNEVKKKMDELDLDDTSTITGLGGPEELTRGMTPEHIMAMSGTPLSILEKMTPEQLKEVSIKIAKEMATDELGAVTGARVNSLIDSNVSYPTDVNSMEGIENMLSSLAEVDNSGSNLLLKRMLDAIIGQTDLDLEPSQFKKTMEERGIVPSDDVLDKQAKIYELMKDISKDFVKSSTPSANPIIIPDAMSDIPDMGRVSYDIKPMGIMPSIPDSPLTDRFPSPDYMYTPNTTDNLPETGTSLIRSKNRANAYLDAVKKSELAQSIRLEDIAMSNPVMRMDPMGAEENQAYLDRLGTTITLEAYKKIIEDVNSIMQKTDRIDQKTTNLVKTEGSVIIKGGNKNIQPVTNNRGGDTITNITNVNNPELDLGYIPR